VIIQSLLFGLTFLIGLLDELGHDSVQCLVESASFILSIFLKGLTEDLVSVFLCAIRSNQQRCQRNLIPPRDLNGLVGALKPFCVGALIPKFKKLGARVILHCVEVSIHPNVGHYQIL